MPNTAELSAIVLNTLMDVGITVEDISNLIEQKHNINIDWKILTKILNDLLKSEKIVMYITSRECYRDPKQGTHHVPTFARAS